MDVKAALRRSPARGRMSDESYAESVVRHLRSDVGRTLPPRAGYDETIEFLRSQGIRLNDHQFGPIWYRIMGNQ